MAVAIKWGLILGIVVVILGFIFGGAGLHTSPVMAMVFVGLAIVINIIAVILGLRESAPTSTWGAQFLNGLVIGVVGGAIIFLGSWIMTSLVFPEYFVELREGYLEFFQGAGMSEEEIDIQMTALEAATPVGSAIQGAIGTIITSVIVGGVAGIFLRKK